MTYGYACLVQRTDRQSGLATTEWVMVRMHFRSVRKFEDLMNLKEAALAKTHWPSSAQARFEDELLSFRRLRGEDMLGE